MNDCWSKPAMLESGSQEVLVPVGILCFPLTSQQWIPDPGASYSLTAVPSCTHTIRISAYVYLGILHFSPYTAPQSR